MAKMSVLLVDDEESFSGLCKRILEMEGYSVITASSGKDAIESVKKNKPDMVFLDIKMPDMDGIETLRQIRTFNKDIPVAMITAYGTVQSWSDSTELKIYSYIPKGEPGSNTIEKMLKVLKRYEKSGRLK